MHSDTFIFVMLNVVMHTKILILHNKASTLNNYISQRNCIVINCNFCHMIVRMGIGGNMLAN